MPLPGTLEAGTITLNEAETRLVKLLLDAAHHIENHPSKEQTPALPQELADSPLELRFTGGWVRDKLLGVESNDIDIAINKMTGYQFGLRLNEYFKIPGNAENHGLVNQDNKKGSFKLVKIEANPEKSKHLETVTVKILGLDLDLVNLRKETYTEESRNPQMEFGTPEEDALRRDATINAMFYNITTSKLEDFTGHGLEDLRKGIIRTPLEPYTTFKDDPLRVLRLIRFSSRFAYDIVPEAQQAMKVPEISEALKIKISKERIWIELEKMVKGPDPEGALRCIDHLGLYPTIFADPSPKPTYKPDTTNWHCVYETMKKIIAKNEKDILVRNIILKSKDDQFMGWLIASMIPWSDSPDAAPTKPGRTPLPMTTTVALTSLKAPNQLTTLLTSCNQNLSEIKDLAYRQEDSRENLGMAIRKWGATWKLQTLFALLHEIYEAPDNSTEIVEQYDKFLSKINTLNLLEAHTFKPLVTGTDLAKAIGAKPGPWMKSALDVVMAWQLRNPDVTNPAEAIAQVSNNEGISKLISGESKDKHVSKKQKKGELCSALITHFLRQTLKPLFSQAKSNPEITAAGRKKIGEPISRKAEFGDEEVTKPWKFKEAWALDMLHWVCKSLDGEIVEREWGFLIPPILSVVDDTDVKIRARGCEILRLLLEATPSPLLKRTGLAPLFAESLYISTTYLPSLTPEEDAIIILDAALPALLTLSKTAFPPPPSRTSDEKAYTATTASLTTLLRQAILTPYKHAGEHVLIAETLLNHLPPILDELGIETVRFLKDLVPLLGGVLMDPLGAKFPPLLLVGVKSMQCVVLNAWPRVGIWRSEILRGVCGGWLRVLDEGEGGDLEEIKGELRVLVGLVGKVVKGEEGMDWDGEVGELIEVDGRLGELFEGEVE
ncbi:trna nucleotidyltransferase [Venturia nashicola]|nr:trna nucleotidyltransferase [Venturia nashicola]